MKRIQVSQSGLTLLEFVIVLLIGVILVGSALTTYTMVEQATVKKLVSEMQDVKAMLYAYRSTYKAIPGDDVLAAKHLPGAATPDPSGAGNNRLGNPAYGTWADAVSGNTNESALFWNHVRLAGLAEGDPLAMVSLNAVGGNVGVTSQVNEIPTAPAGTVGVYFVCSSNIGGKLARMMDQQIDDGDATKGKLWAAAESAAQAVTWLVGTSARVPTPYDDAKTYSVCLVI